MKNYIVGFGIATILALAIFFFYMVPEQKRIESKINDAYKKGLAKCAEDMDTVFVPGVTTIVYRDTSSNTEKPVHVEKSDTTFDLISSADSTFSFGDNEVRVESTVSINVELKEGRPILDDVPDAKWWFRIFHKDLEQTPDTVEIKVPTYIETIKLETKTNWMLILLSYVSGSLTALLIFLLS